MSSTLPTGVVTALDELRERLDSEELAAARQAAAGLELDALASDMLRAGVR